MARLKIAYIGGGSTRGAGTMASFIEQGENFAGSEIVLIDLDADRLELIRGLAERMAARQGRRPHRVGDDRPPRRPRRLRRGADQLPAGRLRGARARRADPARARRDRPGDAGAGRVLHGAALDPRDAGHPRRTSAVACPGARIFNYTNPVNIVAQAVTDHSDVPFVSLCEGPIIYPEEIAEAAGLDPARLDVASVGLNHGSWSVRHTLRRRRTCCRCCEEAYERRARRPDAARRRRAGCCAWRRVMGALPSEYFQYYYFEDEVLRRAARRSRPRAPRTSSAGCPATGSTTSSRRAATRPMLDPDRSRGGIHELELAIDCMDAVYNDRGETLPVNVPNQGSIPGFPDTLVVETLGRCDAERHPAAADARACRRTCAGSSRRSPSTSRRRPTPPGRATRATRVRALAAHPLVRSVDLAERLYAEMAAAHRDHLPARLVPGVAVTPARPRASPRGTPATTRACSERSASSAATSS